MLLSICELEHLEKNMYWKKKKMNAENILDVFHALSRIHIEERLVLSGV